MHLTVTDSATKRISELIKSENKTDLVLRVSVDGGGCSGFMYKYDLIPDSDISTDDHIIEKNGVKLVVDTISQSFLANCSLNFVEQLGGSYFEIKNPNATGKCGCGNSFSV